MTAVPRNPRPCANRHESTLHRPVTGRKLADTCGNALLEVCLAAERRIGRDSDLAIVLDVTAQVAQIATAIAADVTWYETRSCRYRLVRFGARLAWQSRWAQETWLIDRLDDLCARLRKSAATSHREVRRQAAQGRLDEVTRQRELVMASLWAHAGDCLMRGER